MNAHSTTPAPAPAPAPSPARRRNGSGQPSASLRWSAVHEAARVVAMLAGEPPENIARSTRNFPAMIRDCEPWRRELAEKGIADLAAIMEPGLAALLAINARGSDGRLAAAALWREFTAARAALLALLPASGAMGPRRSA